MLDTLIQKRSVQIVEINDFWGGPSATGRYGRCVSVLLFWKVNLLFLDTSTQKFVIQIIISNTFRGDPTDVSAKKEPLV